MLIGAGQKLRLVLKGFEKRRKGKMELFATYLLSMHKEPRVFVRRNCSAKTAKGESCKKSAKEGDSLCTIHVKQRDTVKKEKVQKVQKDRGTPTKIRRRDVVKDAAEILVGMRLIELVKNLDDV